MAKYLIEVPHEATTIGCARAVKIFMSSGSHFLANAEWGCADGQHTAWMIVDIDNKDQARSMVPPAYRPQTRIVALNRFRLDDIDRLLQDHGP